MVSPHRFTHLYLDAARPAHLVALREKQPARHRFGLHGLDQRPELPRRAPGHRVLEDSVPGEEAAHRSVDSRCRAQGKHREAGDAELASEPVQRRAVWSATRERLPVADADVEVSLQDGTLPGDQLRAQGFRHDSERGVASRRLIISAPPRSSPPSPATVRSMRVSGRGWSARGPYRARNPSPTGSPPAGAQASR